MMAVKFLKGTFETCSHLQIISFPMIKLIFYSLGNVFGNVLLCFTLIAIITFAVLNTLGASCTTLRLEQMSCNQRKIFEKLNLKIIC